MHRELPSLEELQKQLAAAPDSEFENGKRPGESELRSWLAGGSEGGSFAGQVNAETAPAASSLTRLPDLLPGSSFVSVEIGKSDSLHVG